MTKPTFIFNFINNKSRQWKLTKSNSFGWDMFLITSDDRKGNIETYSMKWRGGGVC